jgi:hypothetical protein
MIGPEELEVAVDHAIADCGGSPRAAVRVLIVANLYLEAEVERLAEAVSRGFARGRIPPMRAVAGRATPSKE